MPRNSKRNGTGKESKDQTQWVLITEGGVLEKTEEHSKAAFCKLWHPKSGQAAVYLFSSGDTKVHEVIQFKEDYGSWLIDQTVQHDGSLYMTTPVDPVFLVLPYLVKAEQDGKFMTLDQLVQDPDFPESCRLCSCSGIEALTSVADIRGDEDLKAYRFNRENTITWLRRKVENIAEKLKEKKHHVTGGSHVSTYVKSTKCDEAKPEDYNRYAHGLVSDYISTELSKELQEAMGIKALVHEKPDIKEPSPKRIKTDKVEATEDYSNQNGKEENGNANKKTTKISSAQKKLNKVDTSGMKGISSFFSAKPKK